MGILMRTMAILSVAVLLCTPVHAAIELGVLAPRGPEKAFSKWSPLSAYLSQELGQEVNITPLEAVEGTYAFLDGNVDILFGNPVQTAVVVDTMDGRPVASLVKQAGEVFGGVIVARAGAGIVTAADLRGRRIATLGEWAAGGFIFQAAHLSYQSVRIPDDVAEHWVGRNQDELVMRVLAGDSDAAFVRTGVIEDLAQSGLVDMDEIVIVDQAVSSDFGLVHSTELYPEWFMVAQSHLDEELVRRLRSALLSLPRDHEVAATAGIQGFIAPLDVEPVIQIMQMLEIPPYN